MFNAHTHAYKNTRHTPHVDGGRVRETENHFGGAIIPALDVGEDAAARIAGAPKVDQLDVAAVVFREKNVLRFDVTVNDAVILVVNKPQRAKELYMRGHDRANFVGDVLNLADV